MSESVDEAIEQAVEQAAEDAIAEENDKPAETAETTVMVAAPTETIDSDDVARAVVEKIEEKTWQETVTQSLNQLAERVEAAITTSNEALMEAMRARWAAEDQSMTATMAGPQNPSPSESAPNSPKKEEENQEAPTLPLVPEPQRWL